MSFSKKQTTRRLERSIACKVLFGITFSNVKDLEELERFFLNSPDNVNVSSLEQLPFAWELIKGVWENKDKIDSVISSFSQNWRVERLAKIELTVLRIAIYELLYNPNTPRRVVLNEGIELAKQFGDHGSCVFVNGILDAIMKSLNSGQDLLKN